MADDSQQDASPPADAGRVKRDPPTIDLEATNVTTAPKVETTEAGMESAESKADAEVAAEQPAAAASPEEAAAAPESETASADNAPPPRASAISPWVIAPFSGAVAAALVIGVGWMLGWPAVQAPPAAPAVSAAAFDDLGKRVTALEGRFSKSDAAMNALQSGTLTTPLRNDIANLRTQQDKLAAAIAELKSAPRDAAGNVDLSGINSRIAQLEQTMRAQGAAIAKTDEKAGAADSKAADDLPLRRLVAASLLDVAARHGDPFQSTLAAAKTLASDPDKLKPLESFAATGVPSPQMLCREFLNLVPKFSPIAPEASSPSGGILDRLQAGAEKLVQIERTDVVGTDRGAVLARATAAALHNDVVEAQHELSTLSAADRAPAQAWLDKVAARDAALSASRQFADQSMTALGNPGQ